MIEEVKRLSVLFAFFLLFSSFFFINREANAASFSEAYLRLDRTKTNTSLSGLICANPSAAGAGTESQVLITFPDDFSISVDPSNFTTDTSNLPSGSSAWPGIGGNATTVTGKTVTLVSSDLTSSSLYCFNFTATNSTTGGTGKKTGFITTKNSSNTTIDSIEYGLSVNSNDQISVSATVPADPLDFTNYITKVTGATGFNPSQEVEFRITYGSFLSYPVTLTVEAIWSLGTIEGQSSPSVDILDYVMGSATNAHSATPPVIDTQNRTITWSIYSFPGNTTGQTVNFKLRTNYNYSGSSKVNFSASSRLLPPGTATSYDTASAYLTLSSIPSASGGTTTTTTSPAPTPVPDKLTISDIEIRTITGNSATILALTSQNSDVQINYGTNLTSLNKSAESANKKSHQVMLENLTPNTKYYFRAVARDKNSGSVVSDIFTFTTAKVSIPLQADLLTFVAASGNTIIYSGRENSKNFLILPKDSIFQFKFAMESKTSADEVRAVIRNSRILGLFSERNFAEASAESVNLIETQKGIYSGNLKASSVPGEYGLYAKIADVNGNITEQKLAGIKVVDKFTVLSNDNKKPVEAARVLLYISNPSTKTYQVVPSSLFSRGNPLFTDVNGQLDLVLPQGKYKAEVTDLKHKDKAVEFEIGPGRNQEFPVLILEETGISSLGLFNYYRRTVSDVFLYNTKLYSETLTGSSRFFDLISMISLAGIVILTIFAFSKRHRIPVSYIPSYFYYLVDRRDRSEKYIHGVVYDEKDTPIPGANVYLMDRKEEKIISNTKTHKDGQFFFRKNPNAKNKNESYLLMAMAKNYVNSPVFVYRERKHLKFKINLRKEEKGLHLIDSVSHYFTHVAGISFEVLLLGSFIFELLFLNSFGVTRTLPFLLISIFNLILWILHLHNKSHSKMIF